MTNTLATQIKYFYFDLDGTLLDSSKRLDPKLVQLIRAIQERFQIKCGIATGRHYDMIQYELHQIGAQLPTICNNGANIVYDKHHCRTLNPIDSTEALAIVDHLLAQNTYFLVYTDQTLYTSSLANPRILFLTQQNKKQNLEQWMWQYQLVDRAKIKQEAVLKFLLCDKNYQPQFATWINTNYPHLVSCSSEHGLFDVNSNNTDKYYALVEVLREFAIDPDEVLFFGDNHNDYLCLKNFKHSVCVGTHSEALTAVATYQTPSADAGGVLEFLQKTFGMNH